MSTPTFTVPKRSEIMGMRCIIWLSIKLTPVSAHFSAKSAESINNESLKTEIILSPFVLLHIFLFLILIIRKIVSILSILFYS